MMQFSKTTNIFAILSEWDKLVHQMAATTIVKWKYQGISNCDDKADSTGKTWTSVDDWCCTGSAIPL